MSDAEETGRGPELANEAIAQGDRARGLRAWAEAAASYGEALKIDPTRTEIWIQYGHALKESGALGDAEQSYRNALALRPDDADGHLQLGHVLKLMGRKAEAIRAYKQAALLDLDGSDALVELDALKEQAAPNTAIVSKPGSRRSRAFRDISVGDATTPATPLSLKLGKLKRLADGGVLELHAHAAVADAIEIFERSLSAVLETQADAVPSLRTTVVFDVADLLSYFRAARLPTGIQRVQIEVIAALIRKADPTFDVLICGFSESLDDWVEVPRSLFVRLASLSTSDGALEAEEWLGAIGRVDILMSTSAPLEFPNGAILINLGTSWWLQNYFLNVRRIKNALGVKYVPFVHDLIPIKTPEHCVRELTQDFITWVLGVFQHADFFLANSESTKRDLLDVASQLGHLVPDSAVAVMHLDGDARRLPDKYNSEAVVSSYGLRSNRFVIFISTIEARKNHIGALNAWLSLIRKHGAAQVPKLVCVGNQGWLNDAVYSKLAASDVLSSHVIMLSRISDEDLGALYKNCMFTIYPSHYEGWGLPVTESLCYGKVPVVSQSSSLPEAGGEFAVYFDAGSDQALASAVEGLIFDAQRRTELERRIKADFKPRPWSKIGSDICQAVAHLNSPEHQSGVLPSYRPPHFVARLGVYYPVARNFETRIWPQMAAGEMFRRGAGWWWPDNWGVWSRRGGGELEIPLAPSDKPLALFVGLRGLIKSPCRWSLGFDEPTDLPIRSGSLDADEVRWIRIDLPSSSNRRPLVIQIRSPATQDLAEVTDNGDSRVTSVGLIGFYICEDCDIVARAKFIESIILKDFENLTPGYEFKHSHYGSGRLDIVKYE